MISIMDPIQLHWTRKLILKGNVASKVLEISELQTNPYMKNWIHKADLNESEIRNTQANLEPKPFWKAGENIHFWPKHKLFQFYLFFPLYSKQIIG